ncbi:hypothetical protein KZ829_15885 [Actinoplanes hulinensis]|uniref:Uncharacterized protein n=1 Tax=Actinoplanes hulinensis TaxID=1144547 RepID=A0ABS7B4K9_9ACTN|nr:hypothetical protein [Actinoplanes hulinensis]MBW6435218.1 hypothetical protein [Actinoplanes hulinensis]
MVQLTRQDSSLTGTIDESSAEYGETVLRPTHLQFTGTVSGTALTLTFTGLLGSQAALSGTLTSDDLTLSVPQEDGSVGQVTLRPSTVEHYNELVVALQATVRTAADVKASADAAQAASVAAETAFGKVADGMEVVQRVVREAPDLKSLDTHLSDARTYLAKARSEAVAAGSENDAIAACDRVIAAADNSTAVHDADFALQETVNEVDAAIAAVNEALATLAADLSDYRDALAQAPGYTSGGALGDDAISELRTRARETAASWKTKSDTAKKTMAELVSDAEAVVDAADRKYCQ